MLARTSVTVAALPIEYAKLSAFFDNFVFLYKFEQVLGKNNFVQTNSNFYYYTRNKLVSHA